MVRATFVNTVNQMNSPISELTNGKNSRKKQADSGRKEAYMNGCRRPFLDRQWSDIEPAKMSDAASTITAIPMADARQTRAQSENLAVVKKQEEAESGTEDAFPRLTDAVRDLETEAELVSSHALSVLMRKLRSKDVPIAAFE